MRDELHQQAFDAAGAKIGAMVAQAGGGIALIGGLSLSQWGILVGIVTAILGLVIQFWFKWREDQRQARYWNEKLKEGK